MSMYRLGWRQIGRIVWDLGWADFQLKYRGSVLGYFWSLAVPFAKFIVFFYVFRFLLHIDFPYYALYLFLGIILWEYFAGTTEACLSVPFTYQHIIEKVSFPRFLLVLTVGWVQTIVFLTHFLIFLVMSMVMGAFPSWRLLYFLIVFVQLMLLSVGIGSFLGAFAVRYRDVPHLWSIVLQILFWLTPIAYVYAFTTPTAIAFSQALKDPFALFGWNFFTFFIRFQPLSLIVFDARRVLLPVGTEIPSLLHGVVLMAFCILLFCAGMVVFNRRSRYFVQEY